MLFRFDVCRTVLCALLYLCFAGLPQAAETTDAIIARVNGEPILLSQLKQAALDQDVPARSLLGDPLHNPGYRRAITQLIDETLLVQRATAEEVKVEETEISREVDGMLKDLQEQFGSSAELEKYLETHKLTVESLRRILSDRERRRAMATRVVLKRVQVDTTGVQDFVKQRQARGEATEHDNLSQIVLAKPAAGATEAERNNIQGEALKIVRTATGDPTQFAALARKHSIDTAGAEVGGYMGWLDPQGLLPELRGQLAGMKPGDISPPIATTQGLHILLLHARRDARDLLFSQRFADERNRLVKEQRQQANIKLYDLEGNPLQVKAEDLATSATAER